MDDKTNPDRDALMREMADPHGIGGSGLDDDLAWGEDVPISMAEVNRPIPPLSAWHHIKVVLCVGIVFAFLAYMMYLEH